MSKGISTTTQVWRKRCKSASAALRARADELDGAVRIPKDPIERAKLAQMAGLSDEERLVIDQWCDLQAQEDKARRRRGMESGESD